MTGVTVPGGRTIQYRYDAAGNRIAVADSGVSTSYSTNNLNQYTTVGNATYTYDDDGNLISKTDGSNTWTYTYDDENRLIGVTAPNGTWAYQYDALGNRIATIQNGQRTDYLLDPTGLGDVVAEYNGGGNLVARYTHGLGLTSRIDASNAATYYDSDAIGSTVGLTGANGDYLNRYSYLPFGENLTTVEAVTNPFEYVGQWGVMDEGNGLDFMRQRFYLSSIGNFTSIDPIGLPPLGLYTYANNSPVQLTDPSGLRPVPNYPNPSTEALKKPSGKDAWAAADEIFKKSREKEPTKPEEGILDPKAIAKDSAEGIIEGFLGGLVTGGIAGGLAGGPIGAATGAIIVGLSGAIRGSVYGPISGIIRRAADKVASSIVPIVAPIDPNDIVGPSGFGAEKWVTATETLPYTIRFENRATATAPAQQVTITHPLDADLDWRTFRLGNFGWGDLMFEVPANTAFYNQRLDLTDKLGFVVDVVAGIDIIKGEAFWTLTTIDPATGEIPVNPLIGFLPPDNPTTENPDGGLGDGFVNYTIKAKRDVATGAVIDAKATIVFDTEEPIDTPPIFNTIDAGKPTSSVAALPTTATGEEFLVSWSGNDGTNGSALANFTIYVSDNGAPFTPWLENTKLTEATYIGAPAHTYAFYSVARDNAGNIEALPTSADAQTIVLTPSTIAFANQVDFNNDGQSDLVWRNYATGDNAIWLMRGTTLSQGVFTTPVGDRNWSLAGTGDFNQDGQSDLVWRNYATGENALWLMNGTSLSEGVFTTPVTDLNWSLAGTGDFNQDGQSDLVWRNGSAGKNAVWLMNGTSLSQGIILTTDVADLNWRLGNAYPGNPNLFPGRR